MHLSEFKAWFEGYTEEMSGTPTKAQWAKIKQRVNEISNDYTPPQIFFDRYVYPYRPYFPLYYWTTSAAPAVSGPIYASTYIIPTSTTSVSTTKIAYSDWTAVGKAEYMSAHLSAIRNPQ